MRASLLGFMLLSAPLQAAVLDVQVSDRNGQPLADAVAYAVPLTAQPARAPAPATIVQMNKSFIPPVSVIQTGAAVEFPNRDTVRHHVYSFSPPKAFELRLYVGTPPEPVIFDKPGVVVLGCNIHDNMLAYVVVVDTPYFAKSDARGNVRIDGLPEGAYALHIWHARLPEAAVLPQRHAEVRLPQAPVLARLDVREVK